MQQTTKRTVVVTGAASGIGLAIAKHFQSNQAQVVAWDLQAPPVESDIPWVHCDVSSETAVKQAHEQTLSKWGPVDILVNNSGLQFMAPVEDFPLEKWQQLINVMLTGTFLCSKQVIPHMKTSKWGRIINIASIHGKVASPFKSAYVSAKHGVLGLTKVMAQELAEYCITANAICPGFVDTPLMRNQVVKQAELNQLSEEQVLKQIFLKDQWVKQLTSPEQVAQLTAFLASESASTITGEALNISGGWGMGV